MEKTKNKIINGVIIFLTYISFGLGNWYYQRGSLAVMQNHFSTDIWAVIFAGLIPLIILELSMKSIITPLKRINLDTKKISNTLRVFFIFANIVCFAVSFIYFFNRLLFVWGSILFNFIIYLAFFTFFLIYQTRKMSNEKKGIFVLQTSIIFVIIFSVLTTINFLMRIM